MSDPPYDPWRRPVSDLPVQPPDHPTVPLEGGNPYDGPQVGAYDDLDTLGRAKPSEVERRPTRRTLLAAGLLVAVVAGLVGGLVGTWLANRETTAAPTASGLRPVPAGSLSRPPASVAGIAGRVLPVVVSIEVRAGDRGGTGSGFVIRSDGYLMTNNHVVAAAGDNGTITVRFNNGTTVAGHVVGRSPAYDVAVVKVDRDGLAVATLGNSDAVVVGDTAIAVGSPLGLAGTVTSGIISAVHRPVTTGTDDGTGRSYLSALQTDAAINPGNSGGPLVDSAGRVIGVNSAIATLSNAQAETGSIGLGFSIPINVARRVADQLIRTGTATYPVIGARLDTTYTGDGARLSELTSGGPAARAGLLPGDVVVAVDAGEVSSAEELIVAVRSHQPAEQVVIVYQRGGSQHTVRLTLGQATG